MTRAGRDEAATVSLQEAADRLGVHYMTAYRYVRTGQLPAERRDGRWTVTAGDLAAFERQRRAPAPAARWPTGPGGRGGGDRYGARLLDRLVAGDEPGAWQVVEAALVARTGADRVHTELLAPCLREVGDRWERGDLDVGGEHVASAVAARLAARLAPLCARRGRSRGTVVLAGPPGEQHGLPVTLATNVLRARGWDVVELGPNTPTDDLVRAARGADRLLAVGLSVGSDATLDAAAATIAELRRELPEVPLLVGGPGVPTEAAARDLGADAWASDADRLADLLASGLLGTGGGPEERRLGGR